VAKGAERDPEALLPLSSASFHILVALGHGERHGYGIMRVIARYTDGKLRIGPGTLYRSIRQMLESELIEEADERPDPELDDERRRYYRLTHFGRRVAELELRRLEQLLRVARAGRLLGSAERAAAGGV
jgi:DNA-binding PadR family transcriptional regulator